MKQVKFLLAAITVILFVSCMTVSGIVEETTGELILTNIPEQYNGMFISAQSNLDDDIALLAIDNIVSDGASIGAVISNGTARLNVWQLSIESRTKFRVYDYRGNDTSELTIMIHLSDRAFQPWDVAYNPIFGDITVQFTNGKASFPLAIITEETAGELVITNIPARYNGSLLSAQSYYGNDPFILGVNSISSDNNAFGAVIENGSTTLKIWKIFQLRDKLNYNGYDSVELQLMIHSAGTVFNPLWNFSYDGSLGNINVVFNNGRAEHRLR